MADEESFGSLEEAAAGEVAGDTTAASSQSTAEATATTTDAEPEQASATDAETAAEQDQNENLRSYIKEQFGEDLSEQFQDDDELLKSLLNARRMVGQRDEDAQLGKWAKQHEADIRQWLATRNGQQQPQQPNATPASPDDPPEYDPAWKYQITQDEAGNLVPVKGAPPDVVQKYTHYQKWFEKRINDLARNPTQYIEEAVAKKVAELEQRQQQVAAQQIASYQEQLAVQAWADKNKAALHVGGDLGGELTPLGKRVAEIYNAKLAKMPDGIERLNAAYEWAIAEQPKPQQTKKPPRLAMRQPAVAPPVKGKSRVDELLERGASLFELAKAEMEEAGG